MPTKPPSHQPSWWKPADRRITDKRYSDARKADPDAQARMRLYASPRWRRLRAAYLAEHPMCEDCLGHGVTRPAAIVHHVVEVQRDLARAFDWGNLRSVCRSCHNKHTAAERKARAERRR